MMNFAILCIGSNTDDAPSMIDIAADYLSALGIEPLSQSDVYQVSAPYLNFVVEVSCPCDFDTLVTVTKQIEREMGRTPQMKSAGIVPIDIDVVIFNGEIMRQRDFDAYYFQHGYRQLQAALH